MSCPGVRVGAWSLVGSHLGSARREGCTGSIAGGCRSACSCSGPKHVFAALKARFDRGGPHPQPKLFLRRGLATGEAAERLLRAHAALRDGHAVYLNGDIP